MLTDDVLDQLLVSGRYDELPRILLARFGGLARGVVLPPITDRGDDGPLAACVAELRAG